MTGPQGPVQCISVTSPVILAGVSWSSSTLLSVHFTDGYKEHEYTIDDNNVLVKLGRIPSSKVWWLYRVLNECA